MNKAIGLVSAAAVGAGAMYLCDPDRGKRRRAEIRNRAKHFNRIATDAAGKTGRDVRNRMLGVCARMESLVQCDEVSDDVLQARIRSKLGRIVSHAHVIEVKVVDGVAIFSGPILAQEVKPLLDVVQHMNGVKNIENLLEIHKDAGDVPALQGGKRLSSDRGCSPATRLMAGIAGSAMTVYGGKRRGVLGAIIGSVGLGMLAQALTNVETRRLLGCETDNVPPRVVGETETIRPAQAA